MTPSRLGDSAKQVLRTQVKEAAQELGGKALRALASSATAQTGPSPVTTAPVYRSSTPWSPRSATGTLVISCSSHVFLRQVQDFVATGLKINEYDLVAVPGGVQWLALPDILPKHNKVARWMTEYLIHRHNLQRVICIGHAGCSAYEDTGTMGSLAHLVTGKSAAEHQLAQLRTVGRNLAAWFGVAVGLYYASVEDGFVVFRNVEGDPQGADRRDAGSAPR